MSNSKKLIYPNIIEMLKIPRILQLKLPNLFGIFFEVMKMLPAHRIIEQAKAAGLINDETVIIEISSGTFALALAIICNLLGKKLIIVGDSAIDPELANRLRSLGATVYIISGDSPASCMAEMRQKVEELKKEYPNHFCTDQFNNPNNPAAYEPVAEMLYEALSRIDIFVACTGTAGSASGIIRGLHKFSSELHTVAVDTHNSELYGMHDGKRLLRGLGGSSVPSTLDHTLFDEVHWVESSEAFAAAHQLLRKHSMFMGGTSGAAYLVAEWFAMNHPDKNVVFIMPDEGYRYTNTIYNEDWLRSNNQRIDKLPDSPRLVSHPYEVNHGWSRLLWNRRTLDEVINSPR